MKRDILALVAIFSLAGAAGLHSQMAQTPKSPLQILQAMKESNAQLIDQQKKTLDGLDQMQKDADQLRILGKRT